MSDDIAPVFVPALAATGHRQQHHGSRRRYPVKTRATHPCRSYGDRTPPGGGAPIVQPVAQDIALYGPGDIVGIDAARDLPHRSACRGSPTTSPTTSPRSSSTTRTFPGATHRQHRVRAGLHLRPWITLIVLKESEFADGQTTLDRPLPVHHGQQSGRLPRAGRALGLGACPLQPELSAGNRANWCRPTWARSLPRVQAISARTAISPIRASLCPRRLEDNTGYHAFVIPTFETGRLAGLGLDPAARAVRHRRRRGTTTPARPNRHAIPSITAGSSAPVDKGDFEYLVRLLKPQPVDPRVGTRDMDVQDPGSNIPGDRQSRRWAASCGSAARCEVPDADLRRGELQTAAEIRELGPAVSRPVPEGARRIRQPAGRLRRADRCGRERASELGSGIDDDPDPLITAPLYGRWHALTQRLLTNRDGTPAPNPTNWVHRLNLDPRFRVPAAFGADVVETNAEEYMNDAWQQIGDVLAANQRIRQLHLAIGVSSSWYDRTSARRSPPPIRNAPSTVSAPVTRRVLVGRHDDRVSPQGASLVPPVLTSTVMRRVIRPGARLMR